MQTERWHPSWWRQSSRKCVLSRQCCPHAPDISSPCLSVLDHKSSGARHNLHLRQTSKTSRCYWAGLADDCRNSFGSSSLQTCLQLPSLQLSIFLRSWLWSTGRGTNMQTLFLRCGGSKTRDTLVASTPWRCSQTLVADFDLPPATLDGFFVFSIRRWAKMHYCWESWWQCMQSSFLQRWAGLGRRWWPGQ